MPSVFLDLDDHEVDRIRRLGTLAEFGPREQVFHEGDEADYVYFIDAGQVSLYIERFNTQVEIQRADAGDWFGELAVYSGGQRTASAITLAPTRFLRVARQDFHDMLAQAPDIEAKIRDIVNRRNLSLVLREKMVDADCDRGCDLHIGIKGDPSLRESAMERPRYESVVDRHIQDLVVCFEDLLLRRTVHRLMIGFNNGEIRVSTLLDPFSEEFHPALRLLDASYVERHFPRVDYRRKAELIRKLHAATRASGLLADLPEHLSRGFGAYFDRWEPVPPESLSRTIAQLPLLRGIPNFYVRSVTLGVLKDAIHMQFNCDGTHIVSAKGYERFLAENL